MLILSRGVGETIIIGDPNHPIVVTVVEINRGIVRIGIEAPREVPIVRSELLERKEKS